MKAKIVRKGFGAIQDSSVPAEGEVRIAKTTHQNGDHADAAEVIDKLGGDQPLKNDVLIDNVKCCIHRESNLLCLEAEGNYSRIDWINSSVLSWHPLRDRERRLNKPNVICSNNK